SNGVPECLVGETALLGGQGILSVHPSEEPIDEWSEHGLALLEACRGRYFAPRVVEFVEFAHSQELLPPNGTARDCCVPVPSARMTPTGHFDGRRGAIVDGITAEQRVVDGVSVSLDVAGEAAEHFAHCRAGVLGLKLEEDVLLVGQDHKKVAFS